MYIVIEQVSGHAWMDTFTLYAGEKKVVISKKLFDELRANYYQIPRDKRDYYIEQVEVTRIRYNIPKEMWTAFLPHYNAYRTKVQKYIANGFTQMEIMNKISGGEF